MKDHLPQALLLLFFIIAGDTDGTLLSVDAAPRRAEDRIGVPVVEILHVLDITHIGDLCVGFGRAGWQEG